ncbi:MAG: hypothetical protein FWD32_01690 [Firmicutes bacterium]|nr:hypothetical protein [Bacillota bacterium]
MKKNILMTFCVGLLLVVSAAGLSACKDKGGEMSEILKQFDLTDPKVVWQGNIEDAFSADKVILLLRKTTYYQELEIKHFAFNNIKSIRYSGPVDPSDYGYEIVDFRQIIIVELNQTGKDRVVEAIKYFETLQFVKAAEPNYSATPH